MNLKYFFFNELHKPNSYTALKDTTFSIGEAPLLGRVWIHECDFI